MRRRSQACFVKDLDYYLEGFPKKEEEMRQLFELVLNVGTSTYWDENKEFVIELYEKYKPLSPQKFLMLPLPQKVKTFYARLKTFSSRKHGAHHSLGIAYVIMQCG